MADLKFTQLTAAGALAAADLLAIAQSPFGAGSSKSITGANLASFVNSAAGGAGGPFLPLAGGTMVGTILFTDNSFDIGATGATRPRSLYIATLIDVQKSAIGSTPTDGILLNNLTAAALNAQQFSTALCLHGNGWGTTAGTSQATDWRMYSLPVQSTVPLARLNFDFSIAGAAFVNQFFTRSDGQTKFFAPAASTSGQLGLSLVGDAVSRAALDINSSSVFAAGTGRLGFGDGTLGRDVFIQRPAAGTLAFTAASGAVNVVFINTVTSATNYELLRVNWATNVAQIFTEKGSGGGTARDLAIGRDATEVVRMTSTGFQIALAKTLIIPSGANQRAGNATLVAGTVTVANTTVTANSVLMLTRKTSGGTIGTAITYTVTAATSFTITSDSVLDTSTFSYFIIEVP